MQGHLRLISRHQESELAGFRGHRDPGDAEIDIREISGLCQCGREGPASETPSLPEESGSGVVRKSDIRFGYSTLRRVNQSNESRDFSNNHDWPLPRAVTASRSRFVSDGGEASAICGGEPTS